MRRPIKTLWLEVQVAVITNKPRWRVDGLVCVWLSPTRYLYLLAPFLGLGLQAATQTVVRKGVGHERELSPYILFYNKRDVSIYILLLGQLFPHFLILTATMYRLGSYRRLGLRVLIPTTQVSHFNAAVFFMSSSE